MENVTEKLRLATTNYVDNLIVDDVWEVKYLEWAKSEIGESPKKDFDRIQFSGNDLVKAFMEGAKFGLFCW